MILGIPLRHYVALLAMVCASFLAVAAKPTTKVADLGPKVDLETLVPKGFGTWKIDTQIVPVAPAPDLQAKLNKIYNQTLARTYVNERGQRIMLSIAYGGDQSDTMQVHRPEVCYAAQGFHILADARGTLDTFFGMLPVKRLIAQQGPRVEPITYWITVGDKVTYPGFKQKLAQMAFGLTGKIPDGMLIRVSSIDRNQTEAYELQAGFVREMIDALSESARKRLIGTDLNPRA